MWLSPSVLEFPVLSTAASIRASRMMQTRRHAACFQKTAKRHAGHFAYLRRVLVSLGRRRPRDSPFVKRPVTLARRWHGSFQPSQLSLIHLGCLSARGVRQKPRRVFLRAGSRCSQLRPRPRHPWLTFLSHFFLHIPGAHP